MITACWKPHDVPRVLSADAGNYADLPGVFAATHRPVAGVREQGDAPPKKLPDAADDALRAIAEEVTHENPIVIPVLGEPGTGKSHLVRWVWTQFERLNQTQFVVVYVPRARMSMAGVVARLLDAARADDDASVSEAAEKLISAAKDMFEDRDADFVSRELRNVVAFQLKVAAAHRGEREDNAEKEAELASLLGTLLLDGGALEELLKSGESAIGRRVRLLMQGREGEDITLTAPGFSPDELRALNDISAGQTAAFKSALRRIIYEQEFGELEVVAARLNEALDLAVSELLQRSGGVQGLSFSGVFRQLRESLFESGRELVFFIEELKVLGGIERALLETFLDNRYSIDEKPICRVRALVACTTGEWGRLAGDIGTLEDRLNAWHSPRYDLDAGAEGSVETAFNRDEVVGRLADMAGYYLNATRVGVSEIETSFRSSGEQETWKPPNFCAGCPVRDECHGLFGSVEGPDGVDIGLFPYTRDALEHAQETVQRARPGGRGLEGGLNPRALLTGVLEPMLTLAGDNGDAPFPAREIALRLHARPATIEEMSAQLRTAHGLGEEEARNGAGALWVWGVHAVDPNDPTIQVSGLPAGLGIALGFGNLPEVGIRASDEPVTPASTEETVEGRNASGRNRVLAGVDEWINGHDLLQDDARDLRNRIHALSVRRIDWQRLAGAGFSSKHLLAELGLATAEYSVSFARVATGEGAAPAGTTTLRFTPAEGGRFVRAVAQSDGKKGFAGDVAAFVDLAEGLEECAEQIHDAARARGVIRGAPIAADDPGLVALAAATVACGLDEGTIGDASRLLSGLVTETPEMTEITHGATKEMSALRAYLVDGEPARTGDGIYDNREMVGREALRVWFLRRVGFRRSSAPTDREVVQMLDAAAVFDATTRLSRDGQVNPIPARSPRPAGESDVHYRLASRIPVALEKALKAEIAETTNWLRELAPFLGVDDANTIAASELLERLKTALDEATGARAAVDGVQGAPTGGVWERFYRAETLLTPWLSASDRGLILEDALQVSRSDSAPIRKVVYALAGNYPELAALRYLTHEYVERANSALGAAAETLRTMIARLGTSQIVQEFPDAYREALSGAQIALKEALDS